MERIRRRFNKHGLEAALSERPRTGAAPKLGERGQATLIALACSDPPEGRTSWTMQLHADELVVRQVARAPRKDRRHLKGQPGRPHTDAAKATGAVPMGVDRGATMAAAEPDIQ